MSHLCYNQVLDNYITEPWSVLGQETQIYKGRETMAHIFPKGLDLHELWVVLIVSKDGQFLEALPVPQGLAGVGQKERDHGKNNPLLLNAYYVPGPAMSLKSIISLSPTDTWGVFYQWPDFTEERTTAQRGSQCSQGHTVTQTGWQHSALTPGLADLTPSHRVNKETRGT